MEFIFLSQMFYDKYNETEYPEILRKNERPYAMVKMIIGEYEYALPLRSNISHKNALWTNKEEKCGIDYSKAVIIEGPEYIDSKKPYVREEEFKVLRGKDYEVRKGFIQYLKQYNKALNKMSVKRNRDMVKKSTIQYFHKELKLDPMNEYLE